MRNTASLLDGLIDQSTSLGGSLLFLDPVQVLDHTLGTAAHSLTLSGSTLHWRSYGGAQHSATLD